MPSPACAMLRPLQRNVGWTLTKCSTANAELSYEQDHHHPDPQPDQVPGAPEGDAKGPRPRPHRKVTGDRRHPAGARHGEQSAPPRDRYQGLNLKATEKWT